MYFCSHVREVSKWFIDVEATVLVGRLRSNIRQYNGRLACIKAEGTTNLIRHGQCFVCIILGSWISGKAALLKQGAISI